MKNNENCRMELIPARRIKRMPGMQIGVSRENVEKVRDFAKKRGHYNPVVLSDCDGSMTLLSGAATFEVCLEEKEARIPAVIVQTDGEADDLMFALQSAQLNDSLSAVAAGAAIVELIDSHSVPRKHISETLGKTPAWISRMEKLGRKLNAAVRRLVAEGQVSPRSAQEIARLPDDVQLAFAVAASNEFLNKENVAYLVNRYLNKDTGSDERDRIINTPKLALPQCLKNRGRKCVAESVSARLSRAFARCLDDASYLSSLLVGMDIAETAIRGADVADLNDSLTALLVRLRAVLPRGKTADVAGGGAHD